MGHISGYWLLARYIQRKIWTQVYSILYFRFGKGNNKILEIEFVRFGSTTVTKQTKEAEVVGHFDANVGITVNNYN